MNFSSASLRIRKRLSRPAFVCNRRLGRLVLARAVSRVGTNATATVVLLNLAHATGSPAAVGLLGGLEAPAVIIFGLYGGHLSDRLDRQRLAVRLDVAMFLLVTVLVVNAVLARHALAVLYVVPVAVTALATVQGAALDAVIPRVVPTEDLTAASRWLSSSSRLGAIAGPLLGAAMYTTSGPGWAYGLDAVSYLLSALLLAGLPAVPAAAQATYSIMRSLADGLGYVRSRTDLIGSYLADLAAMTLASPQVLLPFLGVELGAGSGAGALFAAEAAGALAMAILGGWTRRVSRIGLGVLLASLGYGLAVSLLAVVPSLLAAVAVLAVAGSCDLLSVVFRDTMWNQSIPDKVRGRVAGVESVSYGLGAPLGTLLLGLLASASSPRTAAAVGGLSCALTVGAIAVTLPALARYKSRALAISAEAPEPG
ncbi:MAG: MFS transporter [Streptosporangiaceae bacterium]